MHVPFAAIGVAISAWLVNICSHAETARSLPIDIKRHLSPDQLAQEERSLQRDFISEIVDLVTMTNLDVKIDKLGLFDELEVPARSFSKLLGLNDAATATNDLLFFVKLAKLNKYVEHFNGRNPDSQTTLASVLRIEMGEHDLEKVATRLSNRPEELEWLEKKRPPEKGTSYLTHGDRNPFLHPTISKRMDYLEAYNDLYPESAKTLMTVLKYKEDTLIQKLFSRLKKADIAEDLPRVRALKELFQSWSKQEKPVIPADAYIRLGLKAKGKIEFSSPKFDVWMDYVAVFNIGKPPEEQESCLSVLELKFGRSTVMKQLVKTDAGSVRAANKIAGDFGSYLTMEKATLHDPAAIEEIDVYLESLITWLASAHKRKRKA